MLEPQFSCERTKTTCPYCGVGCGVVAEVNEKELVITGDQNHPANFGRLCSKGSALAETIGLDGRLLTPKINGRETEWGEALDKVADTFSKTIKEHGPDSVAFYVSGQILTEDYYIANKLMKGFIGSANIDTNSRLCMASSVAGHKKAFGADTVPGTYQDFETADLVVLVGSNLAWCHPVIYQRLAAAKEKRPQMKIVLVDPRETMTADIADMHLAIKPDGDVALFMGLLSAIEQADIIDKDYINNYTQGFESASQSARELKLEDIYLHTGLNADEIKRFYDLWCQTEKVVTVYSQGVNQSSCGVDKVSAIINCHLSTGRIGKEGMGPFSVTGQPNAMGGRETGGLANMLAAHMDIENPEHRHIVQNFWQAPVIAEKAGLKAIEMFDAVLDGRIKAIWIMATNPVDSLPHADAVEAALKKCPFVVVSDILEKTDTVRHAHVALPSLGWGEKDGTVTNSERRISRQRAFLAPPGEAKADWWQFAEVGKRMGFSAAFAYETAKDIFVEHAALSGVENNGLRDFDISACKDVSSPQYDDLEPFQWPLSDIDNVDMEEEKRFFAHGEFYTANRKANFIAVSPPEIVKSDPAFPYILNTGRVRDHWHTMTRTGKSQRLSVHLSEPYVELHPKDANEIGVADQEIVQVSTTLGRVLGRAHITTRQQRGAVFVPIHWNDQFASLARVGALIPPVLDPTSGQPAFKKVGVTVEPFKADFYGFAVTRQKVELTDCDYWAWSKCDEGWRLEFAGLEEDQFTTLVSDLNSGFSGDESIDYRDDQKGIYRAASFQDGSLQAVIYRAKDPVTISRDFAVEALSGRYDELMSRHLVLAGQAGAGRVDKGPIICSCFAIGLNQINELITSGEAASVEDIGEALKAGTNCGSCRSELQMILNDKCLTEKEMVEA